MTAYFQYILLVLVSNNRALAICNMIRLNLSATPFWGGVWASINSNSSEIPWHIKHVPHCFPICLGYWMYHHPPLWHLGFMAKLSVFGMKIFGGLIRQTVFIWVKWCFCSRDLEFSRHNSYLRWSQQYKFYNLNGWLYFCILSMFNVTFVFIGTVGTTASCRLSTSRIIVSLSGAVLWWICYELNMLCGAFKSAGNIGWPSCCDWTWMETVEARGSPVHWKSCYSSRIWRFAGCDIGLIAWGSHTRHDVPRPDASPVVCSHHTGPGGEYWPRAKQARFGHQTRSEG